MIVGFSLARCKRCGHGQESLHLYSKSHYAVRCGFCGNIGPAADTPKQAVTLWNQQNTKEGLSMKDNWQDTYRGVVHLGYGDNMGETTLCGLTFDEPSVLYGGAYMESTSAPCTCPECIERAKMLLAYLRREMRRVKRKKRGVK